MQHPNQEAIQKALDIITEAKSQVDEVLTPVLPTIALGVNSRFNQLTGFLSGVGGLAAGDIAAAPAFPTLAEVAESEGITMRQAVQNFDTAPTNEELERFRARVEALGVGIHQMTDDQILSTVSTPEGEKIIRGAAKQLGFTDFREVPIDIALIERMRAAAARADEVRAQEEALRNEKPYSQLAGAYDKQANSDMDALKRYTDSHAEKEEQPEGFPVSQVVAPEDRPAFVEPVTLPVEVAKAEGDQINHTVTEKTLADNPVMKDQGIEAGDNISFNEHGTQEDALAEKGVVQKPAIENKSTGKKK